jgi:hypothetical protein
MKDYPTKAFQEGERLGANLVNSKFDDTLAKRVTAETFGEFGGFMAGLLSSALYHAHRRLEAATKLSKEDPMHADRWLQMVVNIVAETLVRDKVPVELRFVIARKEKKS